MADGKTVWLPVDDVDAWTHAKLERRAGGQWWAIRGKAPEGVPLEIPLEEELVSNLQPAPEDFVPPDNLINLEQVVTGAVLHTLRCGTPPSLCPRPPPP